MDMTKFENADDPGFQAVAGELRRWIKALARSENVRSSHDKSPHRDRTGGKGVDRTGEHHTLQMTQGSPQFGSTTVSGGLVFQGNHGGGHGGIF